MTIMELYHKGFKHTEISEMTGKTVDEVIETILRERKQKY